METNPTAVPPTNTRPSATEIENLRHLITSLLPSWQHNYSLHQRLTQTWPVLSTPTLPLPYGALLPKQLQSHTTTATALLQSRSTRPTTDQQPWRQPHRIFASAIPLSDGRLPLSAALHYYTDNKDLNSDDGDDGDDDDDGKINIGVTLDTLTYLAAVPHRPPCGLCAACTSKNNNKGVNAIRHCKVLQALRAWEGVLGDVSTTTVVEMCTHALSRLGNNNNKKNKKKKQSQLIFRGLYCKHCPACRLNFNRPNTTYKCWLAIAIEENSLPSRLTGGGAAGVLEEMRPYLSPHGDRGEDDDDDDGGDGGGDGGGGYAVDPLESYLSLPDHADDDDEEEEESNLRRWLPWLLWKYKPRGGSSTAAAFKYEEEEDDESGGDGEYESDASAAAAAAASAAAAAAAAAAAGVAKKRKTNKKDASRKKAKVGHGAGNKRAVREEAAQLAKLFQVPIDEIMIWTCWKPKQQQQQQQQQQGGGGGQSTSTTTITTTSNACGHINGENLYKCEVCGGNRWDGPIGQLATRVAAAIISSSSGSSKQSTLPSAEQIAARMQWEANTTVDNDTKGVFPVYYGDTLSSRGRATLVEAIEILLQSNNNGGVVALQEGDEDSLPVGMLKIMPRTLLGRAVMRLESTAAGMIEDLQAVHNISSDDDNKYRGRVALISSSAAANGAEQRQQEQQEEEVMMNVEEPRADNIQQLPSTTSSHFVSQCVGLLQQLGMHQALQEDELSAIIQSLILVHHQLKPNLDVDTFIACLKVLLTDTKRKRGMEIDSSIAAAAGRGTDGLAMLGLSVDTIASALLAIYNSQLEAHPRQGELPSVLTWTAWKQDNHHHHLKIPSDNNNNNDDDDDDDAFVTTARSIQTLENFLWNLLNTILRETSSTSSTTYTHAGKQKGEGKVKKRPNASGPDEIEHPLFLGLPPYPFTTDMVGGGGGGSNKERGGYTLTHAPIAVEEALKSLKRRRRRRREEEERGGGGSTSAHLAGVIALEEELKDLPGDVGMVFNAAALLGVREDILKEALDRWKHLTG